MSNTYAYLLGTIVLSSCFGCSKDNSPSGLDGGQVSPDARVTSDANPPSATDAGEHLFHIDRSHNANVGTTNKLDYSDPNLWACRPGIDVNPCYGDHGELDTTELKADGTTAMLKHERAKEPKFDCCAFAVANPMPAVEPVTSARLPFNPRSMPDSIALAGTNVDSVEA